MDSVNFFTEILKKVFSKNNPSGEESKSHLIQHGTDLREGNLPWKFGVCGEKIWKRVSNALCSLNFTPKRVETLLQRNVIFYSWFLISCPFVLFLSRGEIQSGGEYWLLLLLRPRSNWFGSINSAMWVSRRRRDCASRMLTPLVTHGEPLHLPFLAKSRLGNWIVNSRCRKRLLE